ncbi:MAG TPA: CvpA family protein [bacterium (Candidatus Stahlbacteria)]|nr:CvpA family protein [Candidatus Stahlbacteria bacterium]
MLLDLLIVIVLMMGAGYGLMKGGIKQIFSILGIVVGIGLAVLFTKRIASLLGYGDETLALGIIFVLILCGSYVGMIFLGRIIRKVMHLILLGMVDQLLGLAIGIIKGYVASLGISLIIFYLKPEWFMQSKLGPVILNIGRLFIGEILGKS